METHAFNEQLKAEGYDEVLTRIFPAHASLAPHTHPFGAKVLVLEGEITLGRNGALTTYGPGDIYAVDIGCEHSEQYGPAGATLLAGRKHGAV